MRSGDRLYNINLVTNNPRYKNEAAYILHLLLECHYNTCTVNYIIPWIRIPREILRGAQVLKKFSVFFRTEGSLPFQETAT